jgi:threonine synthase
LAGNLGCLVYLPDSIPGKIVNEIKDCGAEVVLAGRTIAEAAAAMAEQLDDSWFNVSTLKEPYRVEGKKTMGLEIAEALGWEFPDVVIYPTGGGTGLIGIWKAFQELRSLGWVRQKMPRMVAVQAEGCAPVVEAFLSGSTSTQPWPQPQTRALGLNVPAPLGGAWMLAVLRESRGTALAVPEAKIAAAQKRLMEISAIPVGPEVAVAWRGLELLIERNWIAPEDRVALVVTGDNRRYA